MVVSTLLRLLFQHCAIPHHWRYFLKQEWMISMGKQRKNQYWFVSTWRIGSTWAICCFRKTRIQNEDKKPLLLNGNYLSFLELTSNSHEIGKIYSVKLIRLKGFDYKLYIFGARACSHTHNSSLFCLLEGVRMASIEKKSSEEKNEPAIK